MVARDEWFGPEERRIERVASGKIGRRFRSAREMYALIADEVRKLKLMTKNHTDATAINIHEAVQKIANIRGIAQSTLKPRNSRISKSLVNIDELTRGKGVLAELLARHGYLRSIVAKIGAPPTGRRKFMLSMRKLGCVAAFLTLLSTPLTAAALEPTQINIDGLNAAGSGGIYDPSLASDENGIVWMSYSAVQPSSKFGKAFNHVGTRIAYSRNGGRTWTDAGAVNVAEEVQLPFPHSRLNAMWEHEVSSLAYDRYSPPESRWKMLWQRYLRVYDGKSPDSQPLFEHGWIGLRTAARPEGPWSPERKLMVGKLYNNNNDNTIGPPEMRLDRIFSGREALGRCQAFTEPGMLVRDNGIYVSLKCATGGKDGRVVVLRCDHNFRSCAYVGAPLEDSDAKNYGSYDGFSATELVDLGERVLLMVTPILQPGETYHGCLLFEFESLETGKLKGFPAKPVAIVQGSKGSINGACGYAAGVREGGIIYGQFFPDTQPHFRLYRSGKNPDR